MAASPINGTCLFTPVWDFAIFVKKSIFRIFKPSQHFYPTCKNGLVWGAERRNDIRTRRCTSLSCSKSRLGARSQKPPKIPIFPLWGPAPSPLWGTNPRTTRHFHLRATLKVRAKFGEDRPVNNGAHMGNIASWTAHRIAPMVRWPILVPASLAYRASPGQSAPASRGAGRGQQSKTRRRRRSSRTRKKNISFIHSIYSHTHSDSGPLHTAPAIRTVYPGADVYTAWRRRHIHT